MVGIAGLLSAMAGAVVAYLAERFPEYSEALETGAGVMLIAGLALTSYALPAML
jgi:hypothetical protein